MVRNRVRPFMLLIGVSICLAASVARATGDHPEAVRKHLARPVPDLNMDCADDTLVIAQLANGATRVHAIRWGIVTDTLDVCDSLKRATQPRAKYPDLVFAYKAFTRPRSSLSFMEAGQGAEYAAVLRVFGHLHQTDSGTMSPMMYRVSVDRYFDQIDTIIVDDADSMMLLDNMLQVRDTIAMTALSAFKYGIYDVRLLPEEIQFQRDYPMSHQSSGTHLSNAADDQPLRVQIAGSIYHVQSHLRAQPPLTRIRVYSLLGEVLREYTGADPIAELSDDGLPVGTYLVVSSDGVRVTLVHVWQKGG